MKLYYDDPKQYLQVPDYDAKISHMIRIILAAAAYTFIRSLF